jgi:hypothetical protein
MGRIVKMMAAKTSLQKVFHNQIHTPHELFNYCSGNIHNIAFFHVQEEQILSSRRNLQNDLISQIQYQALQLITVSSHWTPGQLLQLLLFCHIFHNTPSKRSLKLNSKDILVFQMIHVHMYCLWVWWSLMVWYCARRQECMFYDKFI